LKVGDPFLADTTTGPLISAQHLEKVSSYIKIALDDGGKIELGGKNPSDSLSETLKNGYFFEPTIITGLPLNSRVLKEEIFGPVVTVTPFKDEDEVIELANSLEYGLSASVWTENVKTANRVALKIQTGTVWVNCWMARDLRVPFGGVKHSGLGREGGNHSIDFYTEQKTICLKYS